MNRERARAAVPLPALTYALYGLVLLGVGAYVSWSRPGIDYFTLAMGAAFLVMAAVVWKTGCSSCRC